MIEEAGVLAMQGDVREHALAIERAYGSEVTVQEIRSPDAVRACDLVVLPGGESTTISRLVKEYGLRDVLREHAAADKPILATCAGLILVASEVPDERVEPLGLLDVHVDRNAYGRQRESFETPLEVTGLSESFPGVFIRAPRIAEAGDTDILATHDGEPVAVRDGPVVGACFHPELTDDPRFHRLVVDGSDG